MSFEDRLIKLKILGFILVEFISKSKWEWHFIDRQFLTAYKMLPEYSMAKQHYADYIYDCEKMEWIKERTELLPLTSAERVLYGNKV